MYGVLANSIAIIVGALLGLLFRRFISERMTQTVEIALGFCTIILGIKMSLEFHHVLLLVFCVAAGGIFGTAIGLEQKLLAAAERLKRCVVGEKPSKFADGLTTTSILFCVGGMAVVGSIQSGVMGEHEILLTKAMLDGTINITFASIYGVGVLFASIPVLLYQGAIVLAASHLEFLSHPTVIANISAVGGVLILMIGINLTRLGRTPVGDFLPAMIFVLALAPFFR